MRTRFLTLCRAALLLGLIGAPAGPACGHAVLVETVPEDSSRIETPPAELRLRFNEPVRPVVVRLVDERGHAVEMAVRQSDAGLVLVPAATLARGGYTVVYRVMSGDGHPVAGTIGFGVAAAPPAGDEPPVPDAALLALLAALARALHYGGLLVAAGGALFLVLVGGGPGALGGAIRPAAAVTVAAALAGAGLSGVAAGGLPLAALLEPAPWLTGLGGTPGQSALAGAAGMALLLTGLSRGRRSLLLAGALVAAASLALTGHAASAAPDWLALPAVLVHVLAASFWVGALWPLAMALRTLPVPAALALVHRFSGRALVAVPLLIAAGAGLTLLQGGAASGALGTGYGRLWLGKMALVALLLGLAALNRLRLTPALESGAPGAARQLVRRIGAEAIVIGLVVLVTGGLGAVAPPRAQALAHGGREPAPAAGVGYTALATIAAGNAVIEVEPARVGGNAVTVRLAGPAGEALAAGPVGLVLTLPGRPPILGTLTAGGAGAYRLPDLEIPVAGTWSVAIEAATGSGPLLFRAAIPVAGPGSRGVP